MEGQTIRQWLEELASKTTSSERDDAIMQGLLRKVKSPLMSCLYGIVYLEGRGTIESLPTSIHAMAKNLLGIAES